MITSQRGRALLHEERVAVALELVELGLDVARELGQRVVAPREQHYHEGVAPQAVREAAAMLDTMAVAAASGGAARCER